MTWDAPPASFCSAIRIQIQDIRTLSLSQVPTRSMNIPLGLFSSYILLSILPVTIPSQPTRFLSSHPLNPPSLSQVRVLQGNLTPSQGQGLAPGQGPGKNTSHKRPQTYENQAYDASLTPSQLRQGLNGMMSPQRKRAAIAKKSHDAILRYNNIFQTTYCTQSRTQSPLSTLIW